MPQFNIIRNLGVFGRIFFLSKASNFRRGWYKKQFTWGLPTESRVFVSLKKFDMGFDIDFDEH